MAKDGGKIEIKIGADASELEAELGRASSALADTAADATKLGDKVDEAADDMRASAKKMAHLSDSAENTKDEFGELSSGMGALATALDMVDPRLGAAARGMGDLAGASEGAIKLTRLQGGALSSMLPKLGLVGAAVGALGATYLILKHNAAKASEAFAEQAARAEALRPLIDLLSEAALKHAVATESMTAAEADAIRTGRTLDAQFTEQRTNLVQTLSDEANQLKRMEARYASYHAGLVQLKMRTEGVTEAEADRAALDELVNRQRREALENQRLKIDGLQAEFDSINSAIVTVRSLTEETDRLNTANQDTPPILEPAAAAVEELTLSYEELLAAMGASLDVLRDLDRSSEDRLNALRNEGDAVAQLEEQRRKALQAVRDDLDSRIKAMEDFNATSLEMSDDAFNEEIAAARRMGEVQAAGLAERLEVEELYDAKIAELQQKEVDRAADSWDQRVQAAKDAHEKIRSEAFETAETDLGIAQDLTGSLAQLGDARLAFLTQKGDEMTQAERDAALKQFEINKALAIAEAGILAGTASLKAFAEHAGNPILAAAMSALAFATAGMKTALIAGSPPPSFEEGGIVPGAGETQIMAHAGEGVLTASTTKSLGGKAGIDALNSGDITTQLSTLIGATQGIGPQVAAAVASQPIVVQMVYDNQTFNAFIVDNLRQPNAPLANYIKGKAALGLMGAFTK